MRPTKVNPTPPVSKQNASSPQGPVVSDPSAPRGPHFLDPSSPRNPSVQDSSNPSGSHLQNSSDLRGSSVAVPSSSRAPPSSDPFISTSSLLADPSSSRDFASPHLSYPRGSLNPDRSSVRGSVGSDPSSSRSCLVPGNFSLRRTSSLHTERKSMEQDLLSHSSFLQQTSSKKRDPGLSPRQRMKDDDIPNWPCAAAALLLICLLLVSMMSLMSVKVHELKEKSEDLRDIMELQILVLSEVLKELQLGKVQTCTMCKVRWVQQADLCFFFSHMELSWQLSKSFCVGESSTLALVETKKEMDFLKHETKQHFDLHHGQYEYHKFWIGLGNDKAINLTLGDGTRLDLMLSEDLGSNPCVYLQNGTFFTSPCETAFYFICKTRVQFGWT